MGAVCRCGSRDVRVETVPDPKILKPPDVIFRVTPTGISEWARTMSRSTYGRCSNTS